MKVTVLVFVALYALDETNGFSLGRFFPFHGKNNETQDTTPAPLPIVVRLRELNHFSQDMMHKDYVGVGIDATAFLETFNLKWPVRIAVKAVHKAFQAAHPFYLKIFPGTKTNASFTDSIVGYLESGPKMMSTALKIMSVFGQQ